MPKTEKLRTKLMDRAIEHGTGHDTLRCLALATRNSPFDPKNWDLDNTTKLVAYEVNIAFVGLGGRLESPMTGVAPARSLCKQSGICIIKIADDNFTSTDTVFEERRAICANMKQLICYLISSSIGGSVCIFLAAALDLHEALSPPDLDIPDKPPREADKTLITPWLPLRCMINGVYNCATTVGAFSCWFLFFLFGIIS